MFGKLKNIELNESISKRFWKKVDIKGEDDCWYWLFSKEHGRYGRFNLKNKKVFKSSQVALALSSVDIKDGDCVLHSQKCFNNAVNFLGDGKLACACCNPKHLRIGTHKENSRDTMETGRARGLFDGTKYRFGETHEWAKLSNEDVENIRKDNRLQYEIAKSYNVSQTTVSRIKNFKRRKKG